MPKASIQKVRRRVQPLYFSAKISEYQFKKVLWHFTLDHSAIETTRHVRLSANSIAALFAKLRKFFFDHGLFTDIYNGGDPRDGTKFEDYEDIEFAILDFHLKRFAAKHGALDSPMDAPDHHFSESHWRHDYAPLVEQRNADVVQRMMYAHLLEFILRFGPVGSPAAVSKARRLEGLRLSLKQIDQRILWLERNSSIFKDAKNRAELRKLREDK